MTTLLVLVRTLHIGSALLMTSLLFFRQVILRERADATGLNAVPLTITRRLQHWTTGVFLLQLLSGAAWLWLVVAAMNDSSLTDALDRSLLQTVLLQTQFGRVWLWRFGFAFALGVLLVTERSSADAKKKSRRKWASLALSALLLLSLTWVAHAAAGARYRLLHVSVDIAHLALAAVWPVGLIPLTIFLCSVSPARESTERIFPFLQRFSRWSFVCVFLLLLTGIGSALFLIPRWSALVTSLYGELLLGKGALFLVMAGIGAGNRFSFLPALRDDSSPSALRRLRLAVAIESALCLLVILIVGAMGATSPPP